MLPPWQLVLEGDTRSNNNNNNYAALKLDAETRWRARFKYLLRDPNPLCREALKELDYRGLHLRWLALVRAQLNSELCSIFQGILTYKSPRTIARIWRALTFSLG